MKYIKPIGLTILALLFFSGSLSAQENEIGFDIGYGKTTIEDGSKPLVLPFDKDLSDFLRLGFSYYYTPNEALFSIKTGLNIDYRAHPDAGLNYLRVPLGFDFHIGNKVQLVFGAGFYASYLIVYSSKLNGSDFDDTKKRGQFGAQGNIGLGFQISHKCKLNIVYQNNFDLTKMYEYQSRSPGGNPYSVDKKGYDGFIKVGLMFKLIKE